MISVLVNGKEVQTQDGITLDEFVKQGDYILELIVVERNKEIVKKGTYDKVILQDGDVLEIVLFVGGG